MKQLTPIIPYTSSSVERIPVKVSSIGNTLFLQGGLGCIAEYEKELRRVVDAIERGEPMVLTQFEFDESAIQYLREYVKSK